MRIWFWVVDAVVVVSFVAVGRDSHGFTSDWGETFRIATPFLIGLVVAIVIVRAWRDPLPWPTGLALGLATVASGLLIRWLVFEDGTAPVFILVTGGWIIGWMVAWRLAVAGIGRGPSR